MVKMQVRQLGVSSLTECSN